MEFESSTIDGVSEPDCQLPSEKTPVFQVNRDIISSIALENQSDELKALGLVVYDHSKFEEEVLKQVDDALQEQELQKEVTEGAKVEPNTEKKTVAIEKIIQREETDREKLVRLGHMTPFGTVLRSEESPAPGLSSFERYLLIQEELNSKKFSSKGLPNGNKGKSLKILPKNNPEKNALLTVKKEPKSKPCLTKQGLEKRVALHNNSDSEYLPSEDEVKESTSKTNLRKRKSEDWATDDSDWECSDPEEESQCTSKKRKSGQLIDDGRVIDYKERLALWSNNTGKEEHDYELVSRHLMCYI